MKKLILGIVLMIMLTTFAYAGYYTDPISSSADIVVTYISQDPDPVEPGDYTELKFKVENIGSSRADNVELELLPSFPFTLYTGEEAIKSIGAINGRQMDSDAVIVKYKVGIDKDAISGDNEIDLRYRFDDKAWAKLQDNVVTVQSKFANLVISDVKTSSDYIKPGETGKLTLTLENNADSLLKNIKVELVLLKTLQTATSYISKEQPFTPVGSSNEINVKNLARNQKTDVVFDLMADPSSDPGVYKIPVDITYLDNAGKNYTMNKVIGLVINEEPDLLFTVDDSEITESNKIGFVDVKFVNKGTTDVKFLSATLKESNEYQIISQEEVYVGNIDSDDYETAEYELKVSSKDERVDLLMNIDYRDSNNNIYTKDISVPLKVRPALDDEGSSSGSFIGIIIVILIVVVGFLAYRLFRKRKK